MPSFLPMRKTLDEMATLSTGLYLKPNAQADTYYLHGVHFDETGTFDRSVRPQVKSSEKTEKHLLRNDDVLFAAKGLNNFAVVFNEAEVGGKAVASSSFIVVRLSDRRNSHVLPAYLAWFLTFAPEVRSFHKQLGTTIPSISISKLSELEIDIPSLEQQQRIVDIQAMRYREKQLARELEEKKDYLIKHQLLHAAKQ